MLAHDQVLAVRERLVDLGRLACVRRPATGSLEKGRDRPQRPGLWQAIERVQNFEVDGLGVDEFTEVIVLQRVAAGSAKHASG